MQKEAKKQRRIENLKRAEENRKKSEVVQVVNDWKTRLISEILTSHIFIYFSSLVTDKKHSENQENEEKTIEAFGKTRHERSGLTILIIIMRRNCFCLQ